MNSFIYFNPRLTSKLNDIFRSHMTIICGRKGIGKSYAVQTYLASSRADVVWHASRAGEIVGYIREFQKNYAVADSQFVIPMPEAEAGEPDAYSLAVDAAVQIKRSNLPERRVYVLEYQGEELVPESVLAFLDCLSNQRIRGFHIIVISRKIRPYPDNDRLNASVNLIREEDFLIMPGEIRQAFQKRGVPIGYEEASYLHLLSGGWISSLKEKFDLIKENGKIAYYSTLDAAGFPWQPEGEAAASWKSRFLPEPELWQLPAFDEVRTLINRMNLAASAIAVERLRMHAELYSPSWDACEYYSGLLLTLQGQGKKALTALNVSFELRMGRQLYVSAYRILLCQMQIRIMMGEQWYSDERELFIHFAYRVIYEGAGLSKITAGLALWHVGAVQKIIPMYTKEQEGDRSGFSHFLLAASYWEMGLTEEAEEQLLAGWSIMEKEKSFLFAMIFYDTIMAISRNSEKCIAISGAYTQPEYRTKLTAYRKAMKQNNGGINPNAHRLLTVRESEVYDCALKKMSNKEIAAQLSVSENTVKTTLSHIFRKLEISSRKELE